MDINKNKKCSIKTLIFLGVLIFTLLSSTFYDNSNYETMATINEQNSNSDEDSDDNDFLEITKTATKDPNVDGQYRITLSAEGKTIHKEEKQKADIVMVLDVSTSMKDKIEEIKKSMKRFCDTLRKEDADVNICLVEFGKEATDANYLGLNDKKKGKYKIDSMIDNVKINSNVGTNTQAGIIKAGEMIQEKNGARADSKKFIVLFTDGIPTFSYNYEFKDYYKKGYLLHFPYKAVDHRDINFDNLEKDNLIGNGNDAFDVCFKGAQVEYNKIIGGIEEIGGIGKDTYKEYLEWWEHYKHSWWDYYNKGTMKYPTSTSNSKKASFYSIGIFTEDYEKAEKFLNTINNSGCYYSDKLDEVSKFYDKIAEDIRIKISNVLPTKVKINDELGEYFDFSEDLALEGIDKSKFSISEDKRKITFDLGDMQNESISISFNIKVNQDEYFSGDDIETNKKATISYIDPRTNKEAIQEYENPSVTIEPIMGTVHLIKEIKNNNQIITSYNTNFCVTLKNDDASYNFDVNNKQESVSNFYIIGNNTVLDHENENKNMLIGLVKASDDYVVTEQLKMKYNLSKIYYKYNENDEYKQLDKIIIDKNHRNIYIKVVNDYKESNVWTDEKDKNNELSTQKGYN